MLKGFFKGNFSRQVFFFLRCCWVPLFFFPSLLFGAVTQEGEDVQTMDAVVVSATKTPVPLSHVTSAVEVITGEDIKKRKIKTVVEALRLAQGAAVFSNGGPGTTATVRLRGAEDEGTLVLIDGAIVNSGTTGTFNFANLTTDNIERIEILRGAQGMMWGADAVGGVINIVTKRGQGPFTASTFFEYGSFLSIREGGQLSGEKGPVDLTVSLSRWDFTGFSALNYRRGAAERDAYRNWQGSAQLGLQLPFEGKFHFAFRWLNGDTDFDSAFGTTSPTLLDVFKLKTTNQQFIYSGIWEQPLTSGWNQRITLTRSDDSANTQAGTFQKNVLTGTTSVPSAFNNSIINTSSNRIEWQQNFQIHEYVMLTGGYQFREQKGENISSSAISPRTISSNSGFAQMQINFWERVMGTAGIRHDSFNDFGDATTYRITGGYYHKETHTKLRASYATGFRVPTINELFFPGFGNPNIQPEKSQSLDFGVDQFIFQKQGKISLGYFWNRFRNLIQTITSASVCGIGMFGTNSCPDNVGAAKSQGWEVGFTYLTVLNLRFLKSLDVQGQYTYTLTRDLETGARFPRWPVHQASGVASVQPNDSARINLEFRYVGSRFSADQNRNPLGSFVTFALSGDYSVTDRAEVYFRVDNLFDEDYEEITFFGTSGRAVFGGLKMSFDLMSPN